MSEPRPKGVSRKSSKSTKQKTAAAESEPSDTVPTAEVKRLLSLKHRDPHRILGAHLVENGVVVRAFRPNADKVELLIGTRKPVPMTRIHDAGLFSAFTPDADSIPAYRFRVHYGESDFTQR